MTDEELAKMILKFAGGKENIVTVQNCMTRCRIVLADPGAAQVGKIKALDGVIGLVEDGSQLQVVLGPGRAKKVTDACHQVLDDEASSVSPDSGQTDPAAVTPGPQGNPLKRGIGIIGDIFIPLSPAIITAGLFTGFANPIGTLQGQGILPAAGFWSAAHLMFSLVGGGLLGYFAIFTGISAAKRFGANEALGGMLGAVSISENIIALSTMLGLYDTVVPPKSILTVGKGGIIGVIIGVWILSKIEKAVRRQVPDTLDLVVTPVLTMLITGLFFVFIIMPGAGFISDGLVAALSLLINSSNPVVCVFSGYVMAALFLPMVLLGLHHALTPIYAVQMEAMGGVTLFPVLAMAGAGQVGAAIAIYLMARKAKDLRMQKVIAGALPAGFLGVGEPLIYGVTLPLFKPFITAGLGAGFGGAYIMLSHVAASSWGPSGLVAILIMQPQHMFHYFLGLVISYVGGFLITRLAMSEKDLLPGET